MYIEDSFIKRNYQISMLYIFFAFLESLTYFLGKIGTFNVIFLFFEIIWLLVTVVMFFYILFRAHSNRLLFFPCVFFLYYLIVGLYSSSGVDNPAFIRNNAVIFTCYQAAGSLGKQVKEGLQEVRISNPEGKEETVKVNLEITAIDGLSGHSGRNQLMAFVNNVTPRPKKVILNHGEQSRCLDLGSSIYKTFKIETAVPKNLETIRLK